MIQNQAALPNATTTSTYSHAVQPSVSKVHYDHIRSSFLRQSARYLRDSLRGTRGMSATNPVNPVYFGIQEG